MFIFFLFLIYRMSNIMNNMKMEYIIYYKTVAVFVAGGGGVGVDHPEC